MIFLTANSCSSGHLNHDRLHWDSSGLISFDSECVQIREKYELTTDRENQQRQKIISNLHPYQYFTKPGWLDIFENSGSCKSLNFRLEKLVNAIWVWGILNMKWKHVVSSCEYMLHKINSYLLEFSINISYGLQ